MQKVKAVSSSNKGKPRLLKKVPEQSNRLIHLFLFEIKIENDTFLKSLFVNEYLVTRIFQFTLACVCVASLICSFKLAISDGSKL